MHLSSSLSLSLKWHANLIAFTNKFGMIDCALPEAIAGRNKYQRREF